MGYTVAVVGATGAVGAQMIKMLETRKFDTEEEAKQAAEADYRLRLPFHLNHIKDWYERHYGL